MNNSTSNVSDSTVVEDMDMLNFEYDPQDDFEDLNLLQQPSEPKPPEYDDLLKSVVAEIGILNGEEKVPEIEIISPMAPPTVSQFQGRDVEKENNSSKTHTVTHTKMERGKKRKYNTRPRSYRVQPLTKVPAEARADPRQQLTNWVNCCLDHNYQAHAMEDTVWHIMQGNCVPYQNTARWIRSQLFEGIQTQVDNLKRKVVEYQDQLQHNSTQAQNEITTMKKKNSELKLVKSQLKERDKKIEELYLVNKDINDKYNALKTENEDLKERESAYQLKEESFKQNKENFMQLQKDMVVTQKAAKDEIEQMIADSASDNLKIEKLSRDKKELQKKLKSCEDQLVQINQLSVSIQNQ